MKQEAVEITVPDSALDPIAAIVCRRWNHAVRWRDYEMVGDKSLKTVLNECYDQREGVMCNADREIVNELGVDAYINITGLKVSALVAWMRDLLINTAELPFTIDPTPVPELSEDARMEILDKVKHQIFGAGFQGDLLALIRQLKFAQTEAENQRARQAADNMYTLIKDQCLEGDFRSAMLNMLNDFATYPFAAIHGPVPTMKPTSVWSGNKLVTKNKVVMDFRPLSVFDVFWSPDSRDAQSGTAVLVRERMTKQQLYECRTMNSYIKENVVKVITDVVTGRMDTLWLSRNREQPDTVGNGWGNGDTVEVITHYGLIAGRDLLKYGIQDLDEHQFYESTITVAGRHTIKVHINQNPGVNIRPVYLSTFEQTKARIPGVSIAQKVRDVERCYMQTLRNLMVNMGLSSGPIGEVDFSRIQKYMDPDDIGRLAALTMYPTDPDMTGGRSPAHYFHNIPSNAVAFANVAQFFMDLADRVTQIPASLHGEPVGTGANRTFRGMAMLYGNAIKPIQSGIANLDDAVFSKMGTLLYNYNMKYSDDESIKGDAKVLAQGSTGLIQKEVAKQNAMNTLQLVATAASAAQNVVDPGIVKWAIENSLRASGVPVDQIAQSPAQPPQPGAALAPAQAGPAQAANVPASTPGPTGADTSPTENQ